MLGEEDDETRHKRALPTAAEGMTLPLDVVDSCARFTSTSTLELRVDPEDGNPYAKQSFLDYYGNDDGHVRWAAAVPVLVLADGFTSTSTVELGVGPEAPAPSAPASPCRRLLPIASFTEEYVNAYFGFKVKKCKFQRMAILLRLWHHFHDHGIADFQFHGPPTPTPTTTLNVWDFYSAHVVDRKNWDSMVLATARGMARNVGGKPAKHPVQSIYEIIQYCGMTVQRCKREQPRVDKKALDQDDYVFDEKAFHDKKHRARGW